MSIDMPSAEKRREGGKHYVYELVVEFQTSGTRRLWRRYSQFDALRETLVSALKSEAGLPRLTRKLFLKRSSVHDVAINRRPKLIAFMRELLRLQDNPVIAGTLRFFLTPTAVDEARARETDVEEEMIRFTDDGSVVVSRSQSHDEGITLPTSPDGQLLQQQALRVRALYPYEAQDEGQLSFQEGDIMLLEVTYSDGWCECRLRGEMGLVPESYVEAVNSLDSTDSVFSPPSTPGGAAAEEAAPTNAREELVSSERSYVQELKTVRDDFFPRLRTIVSAVEGKRFFNNYAELIPFHEVRDVGGSGEGRGWSEQTPGKCQSRIVQSKSRDPLEKKQWQSNQPTLAALDVVSSQGNARRNGGSWAQAWRRAGASLQADEGDVRPVLCWHSRGAGTVRAEIARQALCQI